MHGGTGEIGVDEWFGRPVAVRATLVWHEQGEYPSQRLHVLARR